MTIKIGSRTSKLALKQVEIAMNRIGVSSFEIVGSYRRGATQSGDIDFIISNKKNDPSIFDQFLAIFQKLLKIEKIENWGLGFKT